MSQIATYHASIAGGNFALGAAAAGDTAEAGDRVWLHVKNGSGGALTVTIVVPGNLQTGDAYPDKAYAVPSGETWVLPLLPLYADPTDGLAHITYSTTTTVTRGVMKG